MNMGWATTVSCVSGINSSLLSSNNYRHQARVIIKTITKLGNLGSVDTINNNRFVPSYAKIDHVYVAQRYAFDSLHFLRKHLSYFQLKLSTLYKIEKE